jgi:hypothetical protein
MCPPSSGDGILAAQTSTLIGAETGIKKTLPQCTANVAVGSLADKLSRAKNDVCPLLVGGLNGSTQHFIFEGKDGV